MFYRWDVVSQYLSQHGPNKTTRPSKEVLSKAKELQNNESSQQMRESVNKSATASLAADYKGAAATATVEASQRLESKYCRQQTSH